MDEQRDRPTAWMWQHDETGATGFVDCWQVDNAWQERNPRMRLVAPLYDLRAAQVAIMDTRTWLSLCAPTEEDFPALYALQGHRVALVDLGPNVLVTGQPLASPVDQRVSALVEKRDDA